MHQAMLHKHCLIYGERSRSVVQIAEKQPNFFKKKLEIAGYKMFIKQF